MNSSSWLMLAIGKLYLSHKSPNLIDATCPRILSVSMLFITKKIYIINTLQQVTMQQTFPSSGRVVECP